MPPSRMTGIQIALPIMWIGLSLLWIDFGVNNILSYFKYPAYNAVQFGEGVFDIVFYPIFVVLFGIEKVPGAIRHELRWRRQFRQEWQVRDPALQDYYRTHFDFDPFSDYTYARSEVHSATNESYTYEREFPLTSELLMRSARVSMGARVSFFISGMKLNWIQFRSENGSHAIFCDFDTVREALANVLPVDLRDFLNKIPVESQGGIVMPWEYFAAYTTFAAFIAGKGVNKIIEAAYISPEINPFTSPSRRGAVLHARLVRALNKVSPDIALVSLIGGLLSKLASSEDLWGWFLGNFPTVNWIYRIVKTLRNSEDVQQVLIEALSRWGCSGVPASLQEIAATSSRLNPTVAQQLKESTYHRVRREIALRQNTIQR